MIEYKDKIEIYHREKLLISHPYRVDIKKSRVTRKIANSGTFGYKGSYYTVDYKLAGKTVEVQEVNDGQSLLVYLNGILIGTFYL